MANRMDDYQGPKMRVGDGYSNSLNTQEALFSGDAKNQINLMAIFEHQT